MSEYLGIDTSNYTTSVALYDSEDNTVKQAKRLLPVKAGNLGLRQSDAVFHHTKQLPEMMEQLFSSGISGNICCVSASSKPRNTEGSYMPCFLCGEGFARSYSALSGIPLYLTSHQTGHILSALYSAGHLDFTGRVKYMEKNYRNSRDISIYIKNMLELMNKRFSMLKMVDLMEYEYNTFKLGDKETIALKIIREVPRIEIKRTVLNAIQEITGKYNIAYNDVAILFPYKQ